MATIVDMRLRVCTIGHEAEGCGTNCGMRLRVWHLVA